MINAVNFMRSVTVTGKQRDVQLSCGDNLSNAAGASDGQFTHGIYQKHAKEAGSMRSSSAASIPSQRFAPGKSNSWISSELQAQ